MLVKLIHQGRLHPLGPFLQLALAAEPRVRMRASRAGVVVNQVWDVHLEAMTAEVKH